jgi:hypothetical protein
VIFNSEIADSGPRLSAVVRRTGPTQQRTAAVWPPCAVPTQRLKAAVGTVRRASRQRRSRPRLALAPPRECRRRPTGRVWAPAVRAAPSTRAPARRPSHRAAVSAPVSRRLPAISVRVGQADAAAWATRTVRLGRAWIRPSAPG